MRLINTKVHGILDYLLAVIIATCPWFFDFSEIADAKFAMLSAGILTALLSMVTRFESGIVKIIGLKFHLLLDFLLGLFLALSPWILKFNLAVFKPHLVFGLALVFISLLTDRILYSKLSHELN